MKTPINLTRWTLAVAYTTAALFIASCSKDNFDPDLTASEPWEPTVAFPLVYTALTISDLAQVNDSTTTLVVDSNHFCTIVYQGRVLELTGSNLVNIPDQNTQYQFNLDNSQLQTFQNNGQVQVTGSQDLIFSISQGVEIDSMVIKSSILHLDLSSDFPANAEVRVTIPELAYNGIAFSEMIPLNYSGVSPVTSQISIPLDNYELDLTKNGVTTNTIQVNFSIKLSGNTSGVTTSNSIQCDIQFRSIVYDIIYGYVGQQNISNIQDTIQLSIFNNANSYGSFTLANPRIRFDINNSLGIPFNARIAQLTALQSNLSSFTVATGLPDPLPVMSPGINQAGQTMQTNFELNTGNSNIISMMNEQPRYLIAQSNINTNPNGKTQNFIGHESRLSLDMYAELPLFGTATDFTIIDTVPFTYNDLNQVELLTLRINIENWFPLESVIQLVFIDNDFVPVDTVFIPGELVIPSGTVNTNSERVTLPGTKVIDKTLEKTRINKILNARNILVVSSATSYQQGNTNIKIFDDYQLRIKIGAIAKLKIQ